MVDLPGSNSSSLVDEFGNPLQIAIDGLAATGKTTVGQETASALGILFLDTGVLYRSILYFLLHAGIDIDDEAHCAFVAETIDLQLIPPTVKDGRSATVLLGKRDITWEIRAAEIDHWVSHVSRYAQVREVVRVRQHTIAAHQPIVMVGRDIANVVLPHAQVKVMLIASTEERVRRRFYELRARQDSGGLDLDQLRFEMTQRDDLDLHKSHMTISTHVINTDHLTVPEIVAIITKLTDNVVHGDETTLKLPRLSGSTLLE